MSPPSTSTSRLTGHGARRSGAQGGGAKLKVGGAQQSGVEQTAGKTVKCFQTRTIGQRRFGWCLISVCGVGGVGIGGVHGGVACLFSLFPRPHMVGSCQSGKEMKKKKKVDGDFRPYFQNWVHPRRGKANCVGEE